MKPGRDLYSPVHTGADGTVTVELGADHPGFSDPDYRARRDAIASLAVGRRPGDPIPEVAYADIEHDVWKTVNTELARKHEQYATRSFLDGQAALDLPRDHIPQLTEVTSRLDPVTAFHYEPVAGLAPLRTFYGSFDHGEFLSTQYIRHHSSPLYTPEPDIVHEVIGHANQLADPSIARLYRLVGEAVQRVETDEALRMLSRVFWFTFEFGVVEEDGEIKTYGAGLLSSFGELDEFRGADVRPLDFAAMANVEYDITHYQPVLFAARSMQHLHDELAQFLADFTDEVPSRPASARR
ncbi:MAG TPA: phenylalanine 4-monooxygenase [Acidimicrobiia bacterium]|nr:phenylalanine 4-monooxygenase [Acidimicrobiia bacterium]